MVDAFITVGSNIEPKANIPAALERLQGWVLVRAVSVFYRTAPIDRPDQPFYLNGVFHVETELTARALKFDVLRQIEAELGRKRSPDRFAARTIDLDIAVYGDQVVDEAGLCIPDPDIVTRPFIAVPLLELAPKLVLPDTGQALAGLPAAGAIAKLEPDLEFTELLRGRTES